jgi:hypothetical protein
MYRKTLPRAQAVWVSTTEFDVGRHGDLDAGSIGLQDDQEHETLAEIRPGMGFRY